MLNRDVWRSLFVLFAFNIELKSHLGIQVTEPTNIAVNVFLFQHLKALLDLVYPAFYLQIFDAWGEEIAPLLPLHLAECFRRI